MFYNTVYHDKTKTLSLSSPYLSSSILATVEGIALSSVCRPPRMPAVHHPHQLAERQASGINRRLASARGSAALEKELRSGEERASTNATVQPASASWTARLLPDGPAPAMRTRTAEQLCVQDWIIGTDDAPAKSRPPSSKRRRIRSAI